MKFKIILILILLFAVLSLLSFHLLHEAQGDRDERKSGAREKAELVEGVGDELHEGDVTFRIAEPFSFPQPAFSRPKSALLRSQWVSDLQECLRSVSGSEISVVISSAEHTELVLNWLIAAFVKIEEPLRDVLVISMDQRLHSILTSRGISSLYVHKSMVINPKARISKVFSQVHIVRLAVLRLINHYGYDVINYDCDAILKRNPQPIFDRYKSTDLIGTFGKGPNALYEKWGVALNTGVMVMRATSTMGKYIISYRQYTLLSGCSSMRFIL